MELFYSSKIEADSLWLQEAEAQHCIKVLRHKKGDTVFATDGKGLVYRCLVGEALKAQGKERVECAIKERVKGVGERKYGLTMAVAPTKNLERYEWFVEKATELGVDRVVPIISDHSIRESLKLERLKNIALSAMKQSLKAYLPEVSEPMKVADFLNLYGSKQGALKLIAHCEKGEKVSLREALSSYIAKLSDSRWSNAPDYQDHKPNVMIMIGPEGDFSTKEIALAQEADFKPITLGSSRLRVETAALACVCEVYFSIL